MDKIDPASFGLRSIGRMYEILDNGYVMLEDKPVYSFLFFSVINQLAKAAYYWDRTQGFLGHEAMRDRMEELIWTLKAATITQVRLKEQYLLFSGIMWLFEDYPQSLLAYCRQNKFGKTEMTKDFCPLPFWFCKVVDELDQSFWPISAAEVQSAVQYLKNGVTDICWERVKELVGKNLDLRKRKDLVGV